MTDKQPEALIRADELEQIGAESSLARAMAAHTIRLLYKENEANKDQIETLYKMYEQASQQRDELMQTQTDAIRTRGQV